AVNGQVVSLTAVGEQAITASNAGIITTVAGNGRLGYSGDGGRAIAAQLWFPTSVAVDGAGDLFIADQVYNVVREVNTRRIITTLAGNGTGGSHGAGGARDAGGGTRRGEGRGAEMAQ